MARALPYAQQVPHFSHSAARIAAPLVKAAFNAAGYSKYGNLAAAAAGPILNYVGSKFGSTPSRPAVRGFRRRTYVPRGGSRNLRRYRRRRGSFKRRRSVSFRRRTRKTRRRRLSRRAVLSALSPPVAFSRNFGSTCISGVIRNSNYENATKMFEGLNTSTRYGVYGLTQTSYRNIGRLHSYFTAARSHWDNQAPKVTHDPTDYQAGRFSSPRFRVEASNTCGSSVYYEVFLVVLRKPSRIMYSQDTTPNSFNSPLDYATQAFRDLAGTTTAHINDVTDFGVDFWKSPGFRRHFRFRRVYARSLNHGQTCHFRVNGPSCMFRYGDLKDYNFDSVADPLAGLPYKSFFILERVRGQAGGVLAPIDTFSGYNDATLTAASVHSTWAERFSVTPRLFSLTALRRLQELPSGSVPNTAADRQEVHIANEFGSGETYQPPLLKAYVI